MDISNVQQKSDRGTIRPQCIPTILQRKIRSRKECFDAPHVQYNKTQLRDTLSQGRQYNNSYDDTNPPLNRVVGSANNDARNPCNIVKCCRNITRLVRRTRLNSSSSQEARRRRRRRRRTSQIINIDRSQLYDIHTSATSNPFLRRNKKSHDRTNVNTINLEEINSVSKIDSASRILFPVCYLVLNLFYWFVYLSVPNANDKQWLIANSTTTIKT